LKQVISMSGPQLIEVAMHWFDSMGFVIRWKPGWFD